MDQLISSLLEGATIRRPPVDAIALALATGAVVLADQRQVERGRIERRCGRAALFVRPEVRPERLQWTVAHELGESLMSSICDELQIDAADLTGEWRERLANQFARRCLLPTAWFHRDCQATDGNLFDLKHRYPTASHELIAWRFLDLAPAQMVLMFDQGKLLRRGTSFPTPARVESRHWRSVWNVAHRSGVPCSATVGRYQISAWPVHEPSWKREILHIRMADSDAWEEFASEGAATLGLIKSLC